MAWKGWNGTYLAKLVGCSQNAMSMKLRGESPFTSDELDTLAQKFGLDDPGVLYRELDGFGRPGPLGDLTAASASSRCTELWAGQRAWGNRTGLAAAARHLQLVA